MKCFSKFCYRLFKSLYPFTVYGKENITEGGAVFVCNHYSFIDCLFLHNIAEGNCNILSKKELFKNKLIASVIKDFGAVPIDRDNPDIASLLTCVKALKSGRKLLLFPEGTRNKTKSKEMLELKGGSAIFAVKAKKPIVPIMIYKKARIFRKTYLLIGKPFELTDFYDKKIDDKLIAEMDNLIRKKMVEVQDDLYEMMENKKKKK